MRFRSWEIYKTKKMNKSSRTEMRSKNVEKSLLIELREKLALHLKDNDEFAFEVPMKVMPEFMDVLEDRSISKYSYRQLEENIFVFRTKKLVIT